MIFTRSYHRLRYGAVINRQALHEHQDMKQPDTLYYDGQCPLCMREVRLLHRIADDGLQLTDLHGVADADAGPPRLERLKNLHPTKK